MNARDRLVLKHLAFGVVVTTVLVTGVLIAFGVDTAGLRAALRWSGRLGGALFVLPFTAGPLWRLLPTSTTRALMNRRRGLGVCFAGVMLVHAVLIAALYAISADAPATALVIGFGGLGLLLTAGAAATSLSGPARWIGRQRWRLLHLGTIHVVAAIFAYDFVYRGTYAPLGALLLGAYALRIAAFISARYRSFAQKRSARCRQPEAPVLR